MEDKIQKIIKEIERRKSFCRNTADKASTISDMNRWLDRKHCYAACLQVINSIMNGSTLY